MGTKDVNVQKEPTSGQFDEGPMFLEDDGSPAEIPTFICTTNPYGLRPGETVEEAIARRANVVPE